MQKTIMPKIMATVTPFDSIGENESNLQFLMSLTKKRDWRAGCVICLDEDMKGTDCPCGHVEIVIFRPCGHSVCCKPCFKELIKISGYYLPQKVIKIGDSELTALSCLEYNLDTAGKGLTCPTCRKEIRQTFESGRACGLTKAQIKLIEDESNKIYETLI